MEKEQDVLEDSCFSGDSRCTFESALQRQDVAQVGTATRAPSSAEALARENLGALQEP